MPYDPTTGDWIDEPATQQTGQQPERTNAEWKEFRLEQQKAKRLEKENAFLKAGINPEASPMAGYFAKGYDGPLDPEAIKAAATEAGVLTPPQEQSQEPAGQPQGQANDGAALAAAMQSQQAAELGAQGRVADAATGAAPPPIDPSTLVQEAFNAGGANGLLNTLAQAGVPIAYEGVIQE
jgi:hypothetical protein